MTFSQKLPVETQSGPEQAIPIGYMVKKFATVIGYIQQRQ